MKQCSGITIHDPQQGSAAGAAFFVGVLTFQRGNLTFLWAELTFFRPMLTFLCSGAKNVRSKGKTLKTLGSSYYICILFSAQRL